MNWLIAVVMGTTAMAYVHSFNRIIKLYEKSERTLTLEEVLRF
jgi:tetrahydromethanopterin S-methyltransferase subunit C